MGRAARPERSRPASVSPLQPSVQNVSVPAKDTELDHSMAPANEGPPSRSSGVPDSGATGLPKWRTLERKDARLRADQVEHLTALARRLSGRRQQRIERITDNTLIRVAVDLLLEHAELLSGDTESALHHSLRDGLRNTGSR